MNRKERAEQRMQELIHSHAAGNEGSDPEFMRILQYFWRCALHRESGQSDAGTYYYCAYGAWYTSPG